MEIYPDYKSNWPHIPPQDSIIEIINVNADDFVEFTDLGGNKKEKHYFLDGKPYIGWAFKLFPESEHQYRF